MWLAKIIAPPLAESYPWLTEEAIRAVFPVAGICMVVRFLLYSEAALVWVGFVSLMAGMFMDGSIGYALFVMAGSIVGAHRIGKIQSGAQVVKAGLMVGLINAITMFAVQVIADPGSLLSISTLVNIGLAAVGGILSGPFMLAIVHPFEALFGYTSNLRLIELANLNNPLLGRMLVEAPGTYHHCLMVSALAEKGAESISVNPLLAKVAGLYHDIGKIVKPHYFIENQMEGEINPHDELPPHMSSLILINHVREGLELAKRYRVGRKVEQIIAEHHGKSRIHYFFNRAKQLEAAGNIKINEEDFRYRGPYPQTKESALVMLADVVEAATRSLKNPTPARIESLVSELIGNIYNDGQLDECEMTLKDLHHVAQNFTTILTGRYHGRIAYPEKDQPRKGKVANLSSQVAPKEEPGR
jgi:putative nucleotidyltransferase with HDIG domain